MVVFKKRKAIHFPKDIVEVMVRILNREDEIDRKKEHFWTVGLDSKNCIVYIELVSLGTLTTSIVHPRETFRLAIMKGVARLMMIHNHPSGDSSPSKNDIDLTKKMVKAGKILGIEVVDHIIITEREDKFFSFKEHKMLD